MEAFCFVQKKILPIMSDTEKVPVADNISNSEVEQIAIEHDQIIDPDAGLSDEARAANVSFFLPLLAVGAS